MRKRDIREPRQQARELKRQARELKPGRQLTRSWDLWIYSGIVVLLLVVIAFMTFK